MRISLLGCDVESKEVSLIFLSFKQSKISLLHDGFERIELDYATCLSF